MTFIHYARSDVSKKKIKPKKAKRSPRPKMTEIQEAAETRTGVAANVAWMLSLMSTLMAEALGLICRWYTTFIEPIDLLSVLSGVMLFVAVISGLVTLLMIPLVFRFNKSRPPSFLVQVATIAGALPICVVVLQYFLRV